MLYIVQKGDVNFVSVIIIWYFIKTMIQKKCYIFVVDKNL